jgi:hypothetical protein
MNLRYLLYHKLWILVDEFLVTHLLEVCFKRVLELGGWRLEVGNAELTSGL